MANPSTHPTIKMGSKGAAVILAQTRLAAQGLYPEDKIDGLFGRKTDLAVRNYQDYRAAGSYGDMSFPLALDGIVGPRTWFRLDPPTIQMGASGDAVKLLQLLLQEYGYSPGAIDSNFGPTTHAAVVQFQQDFGLDPDGIVGPATWSMLGS